MTRQRALRLAREWSQGHVCSLRNGEAEEYHAMFVAMLEKSMPNEPLTLDELRQMGGEPVWVKVIGKTGIRCDGWCEVEIRDKDPFAYVWWPGSEVEDIAKIEDYGKTWACYAYPPARIDREGWVSVEERLPEDEKDGETVLVIVFGKPHENITLHGAIMTAGYFRDEGWVLNEYPEWEGPEVTHWMPLPSPPAELEKRMGVR